MRRYNKQTYERSLVEIERLVAFLHNWSPGAALNMINVLPRASFARNSVINKLNEFIHHLCFQKGYNFIGTELNRYLFSSRRGFRKCELFNVKGSDNVHLNSKGIIKLGKLLKYLMHH